MTDLRVLISGASVAGPGLAFWLVRAGCKVTIVERAPSLRLAGQGIDVRDSAREIVKRMGIFQQLLDKSSREEGAYVVDSQDRRIAGFAVDDSGNGNSFTCDIEILRGQLAQILFDATKDDVTYIFDDMVESLTETEDEVTVNFANGTPTATFDLVVAADGIGSKIRDMTFGKESREMRLLGAYTAYYSVPPAATDSMWSRGNWSPNGRNVFLRPDNVGRTRVFMSITTYDKADPRLERLAKAYREGVGAQKALFQEFFHDLEWEVPRLLRGMAEADDFYLQPVLQVRMDRWSKGRVTLLGDAGYAPSPFTGMGTSLALIGSYILAGEISRSKNNIPEALLSYERIFRPHVERVQKLPPGTPWIVNPQTAWGVRTLEAVVRVIGLLSTVGVFNIFSKVAALFPAKETSFPWPEYEAFQTEK